ncbi:hypothetical protein [Lactiplantibacillus fabifermentans]|uniref:Uncharacterized protein n=2 Tax=Lactiplantibacillus fabifermentans TaxID=483011 RepID=A0A0R2NL43_9LACO|nr:hypothetical protein [Lactiplantibacillus fabifermentans]ETY75450.1 membrane protein [Lactiplantibacillus fabifermentans T30PCM01]KRO24749.1 hypothetical protein DY78_GL001599 [Lactiplantibacillus fabifermentans DSM 21115]
MKRQLTTQQRLIAVILFTFVGIGCALLGKWGRFLSVVLIGLTLALLTSGCLHFCKARGLKQGSGMLFSLIIATGYVLVILGSYGYFHG